MPSRFHTRDLSRGFQRGFTVVEMLAVIGVISVLIAILLPAIGAARRNAIFARSQANLRQIGQLLTQYAGENREMIVPTAFDYAPTGTEEEITRAGKVRSQSPSNIAPPIGRANLGSWTDILWTYGKFDPVVNLAPGASEWDYRFDSPDAALYASGWSGVNPFRSDEQLQKPIAGDGATPFGTGATDTELGDPGYFGGNPFFDARPPIQSRPYSGNYWTTGQIKRPDASMYCIDSNMGDILSVNNPLLTPNATLDLVGVEWRYTGRTALILFLDGHVDSVGQWQGLLELEKDLGVRVLGLDKKTFFPPTVP